MRSTKLREKSLYPFTHWLITAASGKCWKQIKPKKSHWESNHPACTASSRLHDEQVSCTCGVWCCTCGGCCIQSASLHSRLQEKQAWCSAGLLCQMLYMWWVLRRTWDKTSSTSMQRSSATLMATINARPGWDSEIPSLWNTPSQGETPSLWNTPSQGETPSLWNTPSQGETPSLWNTPSQGETARSLHSETHQARVRQRDPSTLKHTKPGWDSKIPSLGKKFGRIFFSRVDFLCWL